MSSREKYLVKDGKNQAMKSAIDIGRQYSDNALRKSHCFYDVTSDIQNYQITDNVQPEKPGGCSPYIQVYCKTNKPH